jgi:hypothetical protein
MPFCLDVGFDVMTGVMRYCFRHHSFSEEFIEDKLRDVGSQARGLLNFWLAFSRPPRYACDGLGARPETMHQRHLGPRLFIRKKWSAIRNMIETED